MNLKKLSYELARLNVHPCFSASAAGVSLNAVYTAGEAFSQGFFAPAFLLGFTGAYLLKQVLKQETKRWKLKGIIAEVKRDKEKNPFEFVKKVKITDHHSLEALLEKTALELPTEWGTVLKAYVSSETAVIDYILPLQRAIDEKYFFNLTRISCELDLSKLLDERYDGFHHYHPSLQSHSIPPFVSKSLSASCYQINFIDRTTLPNLINLLTFNQPKGPELIAYNLQHVYLPTDNTKRKLILASSQDVRKYLDKD